MWDAKKAAALSDAERKRMIVDMAERAVAKGTGGVWQTCSHAEVCRPLLTVSGDTLLETLHFALQQALDARSSESAIRGLVAEVSVLAVGWVVG